MLKKLFGIYPGEWRHTIRFARLALFWALGTSTFETLTDSLFLKHIGAENLPFAYLIIALGMIGLSSLVLYALKITSPYRVLTSVMAAAIAITVTASFVLLGKPPTFVWFALKVLARMSFSLLIACAWTFIDQYHDLRDAKRVYSLYGAAYFMGCISSGILIDLFLSVVGFPGLFALVACSLSLAFREAKAIVKNIPPLHDDNVEGIFSGDRSTLSASFQLIAKSRFTMILMSLSLFIQLLWIVTEFSYMESFERAFVGDEVAIAEFLGKCRATISFFNILIGLFLYSRFLRRAGLHNAILITPLFFLSTYTQWLSIDNLAIAVLALITVDGILFTVEDNSFNLLSNAVPTKLKSKVRIINDSFFEPIGLLFSSFLLMVLQAQAKWLGLSLALVALLLSLMLRDLYPKALLANLKENAVHFERKLKDWLGLLSRREKREAKAHIGDALVSGDEELQLLAAEGILSLSDPTLLPQVLSAGRRMGTAAKIELLRLLETPPFDQDPKVAESIERWIHESRSPEFSKLAQFALVKRGKTIDLIDPYAEESLDHPDLFMRGAAILAVLKGEEGLIKAVAEKKLELMLKSMRIDEIAIALDIIGEMQDPARAEMALSYLSHEAVLVKRSAAKAINRLANKSLSSLAPDLLEELSASRDNLFRLQCLEALGKISDTTTIREILDESPHFRPSERRKAEQAIVEMGLKTVPLLLTLLKDISIPERGRILAAKILARLALPQLQANLPDIVSVEIDRAYFYFYFAHAAEEKFPLYDLSVLKGALLSGCQSVIDFAIHLLGAAGAIDDPELLVRGLKSRNPKIQSHAVESLEKTCSPKLFKLIVPLIDDIPIDEKINAALRHNAAFEKYSLSDVLEELEDSPSQFDRIVAIRLKAKLRMPNWQQSLKDQMKQSDETIHHFAYELLDHETT